MKLDHIPDEGPTLLTPRPRQVLDRLAETNGPVARWALVDQLTPGSGDDTVLRMYVSRLRRALGPDTIETIRSFGYQLTDKGRAAYAQLVA